jgi:hypothetical protein
MRLRAAAILAMGVAGKNHRQEGGRSPANGGKRTTHDLKRKTYRLICEALRELKRSSAK